MLAFTADMLTFSRLIAAGILVWLGLQGPGSLTKAIAVGAMAWTTDQLDGWVARRANSPTHLAPVDFPIDVVLYAGTLAYWTMTGFVARALALGYAALAVVVWLVFKRRKAVAILCVRVVDAASIVIILRHRLLIGLLLLGWLGVLGLIYRRRIAERVPRWLAELRDLIGLKVA